MQADSTHIETLFSIQKAQREILALQKKLEELPQKQKIVDLRKNRLDLEQKTKQVQGMKEQLQKTLRNLHDDDARKAKKEQKDQELIENTKGDFRLVEELSRELLQLSEKRVVIKTKLEDAELKLMKAEELEAQLAVALKTLDENEKQLIASYQKEGTGLQKMIAYGNASVKALYEKLPEELASTYEKAAKRGMGVGIARLEQERCGACRAPLDRLQRIELSRNAPLAVCPQFKRLLYIE